RAHDHALARERDRRMLEHHDAIALHHQRDVAGFAGEALDDRMGQIVEAAGAWGGGERVELRQFGLKPAEVRAPPQLVRIARERECAGDSHRRAPAIERPLRLTRLGGARQRALSPFEVETGRHREVRCRRHPTEPSIWSWIRRFISTAYSIGSSFTIGSMKPDTIIPAASSLLIPRLWR